MNPEELLDKHKGIIRAIWCWDSETNEECLVDFYTSKIIAKRKNGRIIDPGAQNDNKTV